MSHQPLYTNRLIREKSPYLLQHAHNPVDWYPWADEAFQIAREEDRPIFLSIGYATCHWCHVMENESFQNLEIAQLLNESFVNIKVDREEMPEVDSLYMEFAQAMMSGGAGWPLNLVLTPDLTPFFAATYLPADAVHGMLGVKQLVLRIKQIWEEPEERENVIMQAGKIVDVFAGQVSEPSEDLPSEEQIIEAAELLFKSADPIFGGTKGAPKFPIGFQACFLLHRVRETTDSRALFYVERTLEMMQRGGIYDHLGGGFARYCIDDQWLFPHFEKMLYDNAILARVYLEAWQYTKQSFYREISDSTLSYLLRVMRDPQGGFYSAEDADSEGDEGQFYTWTWEELHQALGNKAELFCEFYGVSPGGNFKGRSILHMPHTYEEFAKLHQIDEAELRNMLSQMRGQLMELRDKRPRPPKDDKIITSWNGLLIHSFAEAGRSFSNNDYLEIAEQAAGFIGQNLWDEGILKRRWREGEARFDGTLDDYAFMIHGLLTLFEADRGTKWLEFALTLTDILENDFKGDNGAYYFTNGKDPHLLLRRCEFYDGAEPSGNAVQAENLVRLYQITGVESYMERAEEIFCAAKEHIDLYPPGACYHLIALQRFYNKKAPSIVIALNTEEQYKDEIAKMLSAYYIPHKTVVWRRDSDEELRDLVPSSRVKAPLNGQTALYICYSDRCLEPILDLSKMQEALESL